MAYSLIKDVCASMTASRRSDEWRSGTSWRSMVKNVAAKHQIDVDFHVPRMRNKFCTFMINDKVTMLYVIHNRTVRLGRIRPSYSNDTIDFTCVKNEIISRLSQVNYVFIRFIQDDETMYPVKFNTQNAIITVGEFKRATPRQWESILTVNDKNYKIRYSCSRDHKTNHFCQGDLTLIDFERNQ